MRGDERKWCGVRGGECDCLDRVSRLEHVCHFKWCGVRG